MFLQPLSRLLLQNDAQYKSLNDKVDGGYKLVDTKHDTFQNTNNGGDDEKDTNDNIEEPTRPIGNNTNSTNKSKPRLTRMKRNGSPGGVGSMSPTKENGEKDERNMHFCNTKPLAYETNESSRSPPCGGTPIIPTNTMGRRDDRVSSFQLSMLKKHVHPKLPDYDDLTIQLASLRRD